MANINEVFGLKVEDKYLPPQNMENIKQNQEIKIHSVFQKLINSKKGDINKSDLKIDARL